MIAETLGSTGCVLFDFDGPLCDLFHRHPASGIAGRMRKYLPAGAGAWLPSTEDPQVILTAAAQHAEEFVPLLEDELTREEMEAAAVAYPTPYADRLVRTLRATGRRLAVTTNNSPAAVERYLRGRSLEAVFGGHVHGRGVPLRLKPDPYCLLRALESTGSKPENALMIGDTPHDLAAAEAAGVAFLGYARDERREARLRRAGAEHVVGSLADVLRVVNPEARL